MLRNFLITSYRTLVRNKAYFLLSTLGLSLGVSCVVALYSIINFQDNFDSHQENYSSIYRVIGHYKIGDEEGRSPTVPHPFSSAVKDDLPMVESMTNTFLLNAQVNIPQANGSLKKLEQEHIAFSNQDIFDILTFEWVAGAAPVEEDISKVYINSSVAQKFFDVKTDFNSVLGRSIKVANKHSLIVAGVYKDFPLSTDYPFEMITAYENQEGVNPYFGPEIWGRLNGGTQAILKVKPNTDPENLQETLQATFAKHNVIEGYNVEVQAMHDIHSAKVGNYSGINFQPQYKIISYTLAIFLALIGSINFINLTTARAVKRAKEVGIRKVMGSTRINLIGQFLTETFVIVLISITFGFFVGEQMLKLFESAFGMSIRLGDVTFGDWIRFTVVAVVGLTLVSGLYPAMALSKYSALTAIKIKVSNIDRHSKVPLRKLLVGVQFGFSILLIISALVIFSQMNFLKGHETGFSKDNIISLRFPDSSDPKQEQLKTELDRHPEFELTSLNLGGPMARTNNTDKYFNPEEGEDAKFTINVKAIDENYLDLYGIKLISGRNILGNEPKTNIVVTEFTLGKFNLGTPQEAIGKELQAHWGEKLKIVGVVEDFHIQSLRSGLQPVALSNQKSQYFELAVKLSPQGAKDVTASLDLIEASWDKVYPELLIEYSFFDEWIANMYKFEEMMAKSTTFYVLIALIISVLGLYGLTDYMANAKRKEIGIRKVVGASIKQILSIFAKEVSIILAIAFVMSASISVWLMSKWLESFEYRISIGWEIITGALVATIVVSLLSIGYRSYTAAQVNPVDVLKDE